MQPPNMYADIKLPRSASHVTPTVIGESPRGLQRQKLGRKDNIMQWTNQPLSSLLGITDNARQ